MQFDWLQTSQWDSTEGEYTPRTPREESRLYNKVFQVKY